MLDQCVGIRWLVMIFSSSLQFIVSHELKAKIEICINTTKRYHFYFD